MDQFGSVMEMLRYFILFAFRELGEVCLDAFFLRGISQALEEKGGLDGVRPVRKPDSFIGAYDREQSLGASSFRKKCSMPTSNTMAIRASVGSVGISLPFSNWLSMEGTSRCACRDW